MSFAGSVLKLVAISAFFVASAATGGIGFTLAPWAITALQIGGVVAGTLGAMIDKPKIAEERMQIGMTLDPKAPLPVVYGRAKVGSIVADWFIDPATDMKGLYQIVALCHGSTDGFGIEAIEEIWLDGKRAVTNPTSGELAESGGNDVREHPYGYGVVGGVGGALDYKLFLGSIYDNVGNTQLSGLGGAFTAKAPTDVSGSDWSATTDTGKGITCISFRFSNLTAYLTPYVAGNSNPKGPIYRGPPAVTAIVRGLFVEDPRSSINEFADQPVTAVTVQFTNVGSADTIAIGAGATFGNTWAAGDRVYVAGSNSNDGTYTIASVAASVLTLTSAAALVNEGPTAGIILVRRAAPSNGGDNPALCILDYLRSTTYGCGFSADLIHYASFRDAADYCDQTVDYPLTAGDEAAKRFTCNGVLDTSRPTRANLDELLSSCRGSLVFEQGQFKLVIRGMLNVIENSQFETDAVAAEVVNGSTVVRSTAQFHSGAASCKVTTANLAASGVRFTRRHEGTEPYEDGFPATVGRSYTLSCWCYAPAGSVGKTVRLVLGATDGLGVGIVPTPRTDIVDTVLVLGWQFLTVSTAIPPGTKDVEPYVHTGAAAQGIFDFYVDEVTLGPDPVLALTPQNILGQWSFRNAGNAERWNLAKASYVDPLNGEFKAAETQWPPIGSNAYLTADNDFLNRLDVSLPFTNDQPMAQAIVQVILNEARNGISCQVVCTEEALLASVGDRVTVTHPTPGWDVKPFWVTAIELRPDTSVALSLMEYEPDAYDLATMDDRRTYAATSHVPVGTEVLILDDAYGPYDLVINGDFEQRTVGWYSAQPSTTTVVVDTGADRYAGGASIKMTLSTTSGPYPGLGQGYSTTAYTLIRVQPGEVLRLSGAMKFSANLGATSAVGIIEFDADRVNLATTNGPTWATETSWTLKNADITVGATTFYVAVFAGQRANASGAGFVWVDEIHCTRKTAP